MISRALSPAEAEFREAAAEVIRSNRRIRDNARRLTPFYRGDPKATEPAVEDRLSRHTDPKRNGAYKCIKRFGETLKKIMPGHVPEHVLFLLRTTTKSVVHESLESIHRSIWINQFDTLIDDIHDYLTTPQPELAPDEHGRNIDKFAKLWTQLCLKHSDELYNFASTIIEKRKQASKPTRKKTKKHAVAVRASSFGQQKPDTDRVVHEINQRHRNGVGSYPKIIRSMMKDPVWAARMRHRSASSWKTTAVKRKVR